MTDFLLPYPEEPPYVPTELHTVGDTVLPTVGAVDCPSMGYLRNPLFSGVDLYHHFRNDAFYDLYNLVKVRETGKREVVLCQPLPQTLY